MLTIIMLMLSGFDTSNYGHSASTFMPYGSAPILLQQQHQGLFSFNSFQTIINMGSEIKNPEKYRKRHRYLTVNQCSVVHHFTKVRLSLLCLNQCYNIVDGMASTSIHHLLI